MKVSPVFLQAEEPLQVSLYIFMPLNKKVVPYQKKGEILPTAKLLELMKLSSSVILTPINEGSGAMDEVVQDIAQDLETSGSIHEKTSEAASRVVQSLAQIQEIASEEVRLTETHSILDESSKMVTSIVSLLKESGSKKGFQKVLTNLKSDHSSLESHHRHTSALAVLLLLSFGEGNSSDVADLAFASSIHDLGLKSLPEAELLRHVQGDEIKSVLSPALAAKTNIQTPRTKHIDGTLKALKDSGTQISENVFKIISQHHENFDGSGPIGLSGRKIFGSARILRLTDDITCLLNPLTGISDLESAFQGLKAANVKAGQVRYYDLELIDQLDKVMHNEE